MKTLKTENYLLRQFTSNDIQNVFKGLSNPEVIKYYGISFSTLEETKEQISWFADLEKNETGIWWAICSLDNKTFYGAGGFNNLEKEHQKAEIGFWLLPEFWGKGIMKEVMPLICTFGFTKLNLHRIEGFVESTNIKCKKAITKVNFTYEGRLKDAEIKNGEFISVDVYSLIKEF